MSEASERSPLVSKESGGATELVVGSGPNENEAGHVCCWVRQRKKKNTSLHSRKSSHIASKTHTKQQSYALANVPEDYVKDLQKWILSL